MNTSEIINICQQLQQEGKEPSIALIKARLTKGQPMPALIAGLQQWRANPNVKFTPSEVPEQKMELTLEQRVAQLELQVAELTKQLSLLNDR